MKSDNIFKKNHNDSDGTVEKERVMDQDMKREEDMKKFDAAMDQQAEPEQNVGKKKRKKLNEIPVSDGVMKRSVQLIAERLTNMMMVVKSGKHPSECLMAEICMLEAKVDALMMMMEEKLDYDFSDFNHYLERATTSNVASAVNIRQMMQGK